MKQTKLLGTLLLVLLLSACAPLAAPDDSAAESTMSPATPIIAVEGQGPARILFVGNTQISTNKGLDTHLAAMVASAGLPFAVETSSIFEPGASLGELWAAGDTTERIRQEDWDLVILQAAGTEQPEAFLTAAKQFADVILENDALPALLILRDADGEGIRNIHEVASALSLPLINPAHAWQNSETSLLEVPLDDAKYEGYPSIAGTYLDTALLYAVLFGQSPEGLVYRPVDLLPDPQGEASGVVITYEAIQDKWTISDADAVRLQQIAWQSVQDGAVVFGGE